MPRVPPNPKSPDPLSQPPRNPKGVLAPTHHDVPPYVHGPVPRGRPSPKSLNPLSQLRRSPKGVLAPTHHDVPPYVHGPVPRGPPNPKSPNPLSQPPRNPKGVLVPKHHDVPPTHHFCLFFKGCTATSDGILASHLWLLQVTEFLVSQATCPPPRCSEIFLLEKHDSLPLVQKKSSAKKLKDISPRKTIYRWPQKKIHWQKTQK